MAPCASFRVGVSSVMYFCLAFALPFATFNTFGLIAHAHAHLVQVKNSSCPCSDPSLCLPVNITREKEIIAFSVEGTTVNVTNWHQYDWDHITTIVYFHNPVDEKLMCYAHSKGVRVVEAGSFSRKTMANETLREKWVENTVNRAVENHLDGINLDVELTLTKEEAPLVTTMVQLTTDAFHKAIPSSKVSFDAPYTAASKGRPYEYDKIAAILDYIIIMAYGMPFAEGVVGVANSHDAFSRMMEGMEVFRSRGIPTSKLVLAVPWYGFNFDCISFSQNICYTAHEDCFDCVPAVRASVSMSYRSIMRLIRSNVTTEPTWNNTCESVYVSYKKSDVVHQIWYDNPDSLSLRYYYAKVLDLLGVAMWTADSVDYSDDPVAKNQTKAMWDAIATFVEP